jgi:F-type H+-transporting ATPase subunit epsilon
MKVTILTPDKEVYNGEANSVKVPGINGQFEILNNHAPIISALMEGEVRLIDKTGARQTFTIKSGFVEVINNEVSVLAQGVA